MKWKKYTDAWHVGHLDNSIRKKVGSCKVSPIRKSEDGKYTWQARFYLNGLDERCKGFISLILIFFQKNSDTPVFFKGSIGILDSDRDPMKLESISERRDYMYMSLKFAGHEFVQSYHGADGMYAYYKIYLQQSDEEDLPIRESHLKFDLKALLDGGKYSDIEIMCSDGKIINAHKNILTNRSPVFSAMLEHDMLENESGQIKILDCSSEAAESLLCFIYSGEVDIPNFKVAMELLNQAEKYQLHDLKSACVDNIANNLKISNVCEVLAFSEKTTFEELKMLAMNYISFNLEKFSPSEIETLLIDVPTSFLPHLFVKFSQRMRACWSSIYVGN